MIMKKELDFGWGNPYFLLNVLSNHKSVLHSVVDTKKCSYGPDQGSVELIQQTREVIKKTTGQSYKHILITHGATGAINSILRFMKETGSDTVRTNKFGYPFYEEMIRKAGLNREHTLVAPRPPHKSFALIDSPSNPEGKQSVFGSVYTDVWDSVYHNKIYTENLWIIPGHHIMVGSYSKLLGITGARVGWIATNDIEAYEALLKDHLHELATINLFSQIAISNLLDNLDLDLFIVQGKKSLDDNKTQMQKIEYIFDNQPVQKNGMFYLAQADKDAVKLLKKCNVKYVDLGDNYVRLNVGQSKEMVDNLILTIHKEDKK